MTGRIATQRHADSEFFGSVQRTVPYRVLQRSQSRKLRHTEPDALHDQRSNPAAGQITTLNPGSIPRQTQFVRKINF
jgi:hypothetical protein